MERAARGARRPGEADDRERPRDDARADGLHDHDLLASGEARGPPVDAVGARDRGSGAGRHVERARDLQR